VTDKIPHGVTSRIYGGLGNQMFQYAAGRALSLRLGQPFYLENGWFALNHEHGTTRDFQLTAFPHVAEAVTGILAFPERPQKKKLLERLCHSIKKRFPGYQSNEPKKIQEPHFQYWSGFLDLKAPVILDGYWQTERYFAEYRREILHDFAFPELPPQAAAMRDRILAAHNPVSFHIRRGDYVNNAHVSALFGNMGDTYWSNALKLLEAECGTMTLFLFSDDPEWVKQNFDSHGHEAVIVDLDHGDTPWHDMHLMSLCRHHIIANSSFSWWGAWLAQQEGTTIAPKTWFANLPHDTSDICPASWKRV